MQFPLALPSTNQDQDRFHKVFLLYMTYPTKKKGTFYDKYFLINPGDRKPSVIRILVLRIEAEGEKGKKQNQNQNNNKM